MAARAERSSKCRPRSLATRPRRSMPSTRSSPHSVGRARVAWTLLLAPLGIVWHELVGHALIGLFCGGRITRMQCLGVQLAPRLAWTGLREGLGAVEVVDLPTRAGENLTQLAGSLSTLLAAAAALWILRGRRVDGARRAALAWIGLWSLDIVAFTLPSLGLHRYVLFGTTHSEPYEAAVALGIPGTLFQVLAIGSGLLILAGIVRELKASPAGSRAIRPRTRWRSWLIRSATAIALLVLTASVGWLACRVPSQPKPVDARTNWVFDPAMRVEGWQQDIDALALELPKRHRNAFFKCRREDFENAAAALRADVTRKDDEEIVVGLMKLVAMIGDAHTAIDVGSLQPPFHRFPLLVYVFSDGPVILAAREAQSDLIGCRLVKFGGVTAEEALRRASVAGAYENESAFLGAAPRLLCVPEIAHDVGLIPTIGEATIEVRDGEHEERSVVLTPMASGEKLAYAPMDEAKLPLSRQRHPHANWFRLLAQPKGLYLRYSTCEDEPDQSVASLADQMLEAIDTNAIERVVVDLRANGGGNSELLMPFFRGLKRRKAIAHPGGIAVLIGRGTFSSAHMHAVYLKEELGATLIGEPTGQKPNAYGEVRWFLLPHSQIAVRYSTKYWRTASDDAPSLDPDLFVSQASSDYFGMRDPVLEMALTMK
jgi:hypothetical protein